MQRYYCWPGERESLGDWVAENYRRRTVETCRRSRDEVEFFLFNCKPVKLTKKLRINYAEYALIPGTDVIIERVILFIT